jgi:hypothetical protein
LNIKDLIPLATRWTWQLRWVGIMPIIANKCFIMTGNMETNPMQKLDHIIVTNIFHIIFIQLKIYNY